MPRPVRQKEENDYRHQHEEVREEQASIQQMDYMNSDYEEIVTLYLEVANLKPVIF
jgi:hypothetical protein